jgi:hypothetical protein
LKSPATTVALLKLGAVVGVKGTVENVGGVDRLTRVGITCAPCHSTVDDSVMPGIGHRRDGWPNTTLNPGAIIALSPALTPAQKAIYNSWGPGRYDPRFNQDGKNAPVLISPAYGLRGSPHATFTGDGDISYWNNYVAVTQMGGQGRFVDERLGIEFLLPPGVPDLVATKLRALREYQLSLDAPPPPHAAVRSSTARAAARAAIAAPSGRRSRFTSPRRRGWSPCTPRAAPPGAIGRRRCAASGSTRRTSTTGARRAWPRWSITTSASSGCASAPPRRWISSST